MKNKTNKMKFFSLVELMVAVAILIIMMGFLFQFTIGAQRIWSASNANATSFEDANIVFQFLEEDLKNIIFKDEETNQNRGIPLFFGKSSGNVIFAFMTSTRPNSQKNHSDADNTGAYYVVYYYNATAKQLSRLIWDSTVNSINPFFFIGTKASDFNETTLNGDLLALIANSPNNEILCKNVEVFDIHISPTDQTQGFADKQLAAVKVSFVLQVESTGDTVTQAENRRGFSKLIFLPEAN